ncbi:ankyrin repeat domain-containing protein 22-like [Rhodnius prolixus]|uniref:ankyrin repeat domain-containing protein 22-like n=1 Tax=Rhodnius prolixus TaxID=13249 RepID=UPI003D18C4F6
MEVYYNKAVLKGDCSLVKNLLEKSADPDEPQWEVDGNTPLLLAAPHGFVDIIRTLFSYGCNMNARTIHGETALHLSIVGKKCFFECIDVLLELGCDPNIQENIRGQTPLHALVKYLIISDDYSRTSLKTLRNLFMKCNPNITDCRNRTALHYVASTHTNMLCVEMLVKLGTEIRNTRGETALHEALETDNSLQVIFIIARNSIISEVNVYGETALHIAARKGRTSVMKMLINMGIPVNKKDLNGNTALHLVAERGYERAVELIISSKDVEVNAQNNEGLTPLHVAVESGFLTVVELLLKARNCDVNMKTKEFLTALDLAQQEYRRRSHPQLSEILFKEINRRANDKEV